MNNPKKSKMPEIILSIAPSALVGFLTVATVALVFASQGYQCSRTTDIEPSVTRIDTTK